MRAPYKLFLSHKTKDAEAAVAIKTALEACVGKDKLAVYVCEDTEPGCKYREDVIGNLKNSNALIFLYTSAGQNFEWCLYETGFFDGKMVTGRHAGKQRAPLIVLHGKGMDVPTPLRDFQNILVDPNNQQPLTLFLRWLLGPSADGPALNPRALDNKNTRGDLYQAFLSPFGFEEKPIPFERCVTFQFTAQQIAKLGQDHAIDEKVVVTGHNGSLDIYGFARATQNVTWQQLLERLQQENTPWKGSAVVWANNLAFIFRNAVNEIAPDKGLPLYYSFSRKASYRPSLSSMLKKGDGGVEFDIRFTKMPRELVQYPPGEFGWLLHLLDFCRMFYVGVLESPELSRLLAQQPIDDRELDALLDSFQTAMNNVRAEFQNRGLGVQHVTDAFGRADDPGCQKARQQAAERLKEYYDNQAKLQAAVHLRDRDGIRLCFQTLRTIVNQFTQTVVISLSERVQRL